MAAMLLKMAGVELTLVMRMGSWTVAPTGMLPKSREAGAKTRLAGVSLPMEFVI